ncbi:MAG: hypothetical protein ACC662_01390 [Planctomycetota bacterium]
MRRLVLPWLVLLLVACGGSGGAPGSPLPITGQAFPGSDDATVR